MQTAELGASPFFYSTKIGRPNPFIAFTTADENVKHKTFFFNRSKNNGNIFLKSNT